MLSKKEKDVLAFFSVNDLEASSRPFVKASKALGMSETGLIDMLKSLQKKGFIKGLRGVVDHRRAGYRENALIAWRARPGQKKAKNRLVQDVFMADDRISHCYERCPHEKFNYNIFTMMHARSRKEVLDFVRSQATDGKFDHEVLFTEKELKKDKLHLGELLC
ncbi:MAG: hypothetical protein HQL16_08060 [Candidatus Omnitrophica bacterium]|nr:hypothetical protein [Candidatus Omnitrophota bacterium]